MTPDLKILTERDIRKATSGSDFSRAKGRWARESSEFTLNSCYLKRCELNEAAILGTGGTEMPNRMKV